MKQVLGQLPTQDEFYQNKIPIARGYMDFFFQALTENNYFLLR
jgi:hypothetical protein